MLAADHILANTDQHLGNFSAFRNAKTLKWIDMVPIFDSGTNRCQSDQIHFIASYIYFPAKPFASKQDDQLQLVDSALLASLSWRNLKGIGQACCNILAQSQFIAAKRANVIPKKLETRAIMLFEKLQ